MKKWLFGFLLMFFFACISNTNEEVIYYKEKQFSFSHLRDGTYNLSDKWIKKSENILMLHETFKKIGYKKLLTDFDSSQTLFYGLSSFYLDINKSFKTLVDSLELTYSNYEAAPKYYKEFWRRRVVEKNEAAVYRVLKEVKLEMLENEQLKFDETRVNDTLYNLLSYEVPKRKLSESERQIFLNYLKDIGLHQSIENVITGENDHFDSSKLAHSSYEILEKLTVVNANSTASITWFEDNTK